MLAVRRTEKVTLTSDTSTAEAVVGAPETQWQRMSAGDGTKGPRVSDWTTIQIPSSTNIQGHRYILARRSIDDPTDLVVLTLACVADNEHASRSRTVLRRFLSADGHVLGTLDPVQVDIAQGKGIRCRTVVDVLPSPSTIEGGEYSFDASLAPHSGSDPDWAEVRFSVGSSKLSSECSAPPKP